MNKSIYQILREFQNFADKHISINQFYAGSKKQAVSNNWDYPLMFVEILPSPIHDGEAVPTFNIYFWDFPATNNEEDYRKKISRTYTFVYDFMTYFNKNEETFGFMLQNDTTPSPEGFALDDGVIGWRTQFSAQVKAAQNENLLPME